MVLGIIVLQFSRQVRLLLIFEVPSTELPSQWMRNLRGWVSVGQSRTAQVIGPRKPFRCGSAVRPLDRESRPPRYRHPETTFHYRPPGRYERQGPPLILVRLLPFSISSSLSLMPSILVAIMATEDYNPLTRIPMGRLASSSSLPPELKTLLNEFGNRFWQFDAATIANMLSPSAALPSSLIATAYSLLDQNLSDWPEDTDENSFHGPLVDSLNNFFDASNRALDLSDPPVIERDARWHAELRFVQVIIAYRQEFGALKTGAIGGMRDTGQRLELAIPVELDSDWLSMVAYVVRVARVLWSECPMRRFGLFIGFQYTTLKLRFFIVHRGGMTASEPLSIVEEQGKKEILRVFLSVLTWRSEEETGIPKFFRDGLTVHIPAGAC